MVVSHLLTVLEPSDLVCDLGNLICEFRSVSILKLLLKVGYIPLERGNSFTVQCFLLLKLINLRARLLFLLTHRSETDYPFVRQRFRLSFSRLEGRNVSL